MCPINFCITLLTFSLFDSGKARGASSGTTLEPRFAEPIPNITVAVGRTVTLPCVVENLQTYQVAWVHVDRHALLTLHDRVITRNHHYTISHNGHRTWWLQISNVEEADRGTYMCQINTSPMKSQVGHLEVVVPPKIDENFTSSDVDVREGADVSLQCRASGSPPPNIRWRREDQKDTPQGFSLGSSSLEGEYLNISRVSRLHMGAYLCIASNGVQPSVSKRIMLNVNFAPMIWIPNQLVGAPLETNVVLDCRLESYPKSVTYWMKDDGIMILSNSKYNTVLEESGHYKAKMQLRINNLSPRDLGDYSCVAKNSLGETEGTIKLYEIPRPTTVSSTFPQYISKSTKNEGTQHTTSEKIFPSTWQNSLYKDDNDASRKSELSTELQEKDITLGIASSAAHNKPREKTSDTKNDQIVNGSSADCQGISSFLMLAYLFFATWFLGVVCMHRL